LAPENAPTPRGANEPLIPLTILDAPQQRFYAFAIYVALWAWKLYDWVQVVEDGEGSWALFAKWIIIDCAYLFLLPELRIPWLELSQSVVTFVYMGHVLITWMLMFLIPVR
jgi:nucleoporin POM152